MLQFLLHSNFSACAVLSCTHSAADCARDPGRGRLRWSVDSPRGRKKFRGAESSYERAEAGSVFRTAGFAAAYSVSFWTMNACTSSGLVCGAGTAISGSNCKHVACGALIHIPEGSHICAGSDFDAATFSLLNVRRPNQHRLLARGLHHGY